MLFLKENPSETRNKKAMEQFELSKQEEDLIKKKNDKFNQTDYYIKEPLNNENAAEF